MPELPEVETIKNDLINIFKGDTFERVEVREPFVLGNIDISALTQGLIGKTVSGVERIGKMIRIKLGSEMNLLIHLRMTGKLVRIEPLREKCDSQSHVCAKEQIDKHTHVIFYFQKAGILAFSDVRKFGRIYLKADAELGEVPYVKTLGIDPLSQEFSLNNFVKMLSSSSKQNVKAFLLDQHRIAGLGNIYVSEVLFEAGISPLRIVSSLSKTELEKLHGAIIDILKRAIKARGTTFSDYRDVAGLRGGFQNFLMVYNQSGKKCKNCDGTVEKFKQNGRSTYWCKNCQK